MLTVLRWILLGIVLLILFLLLIPVHTRVRYDGTLGLWCGLGPFSLRIIPLRKSKKIKPQKTKVQDAEKNAKGKQEKRQKFRKKLTPEIIFDLIHLGAEALGAMRRRLVIRNLTIHMKAASGDAAGTALLYGRMAAAVSSLYPVLDRNLRIRHTDIAVDADFEGRKMDVLADVTLAACPFRLLIAAVVLLVHFLRIYFKMKHHNQPTIDEKGGKAYEQYQ